MLRRVVTAEADGAGIFMADAQVVAIDLGEGAKVFEMWRSPAPDNLSDIPSTAASWSVNPPAGGSFFLVAEFPPARGGAEAYMHRTATIDFGIIVEGELTLGLEQSEKVFHAGDSFVQRQAVHGWINRRSRPAQMAVILIDGEQ